MSLALEQGDLYQGNPTLIGSAAAPSMADDRPEKQFLYPRQIIRLVGQEPLYMFGTEHN
jgi:hypothetical protein